MNSHLETDFDVTDTFSALGGLAENPLHVEHFDDSTEEGEAFTRVADALECGGLEIDVECQGARLA